MTVVQGRIWVGVMAGLLVLGPTAIADTVHDDPDNRISSTLGTAGAYPCSRADMTNATFQDPERGRDAVLVRFPSLLGACPSDEVVEDRVHYVLTYTAYRPLVDEEADYVIEVDTTWEDGEVVWTLVTEYAEWDGGWSSVSYGDASELVDVPNATVEIPAPGEPPLDDIVLRTYDMGVRIDRMPNRGKASFGS